MKMEKQTIVKLVVVDAQLGIHDMKTLVNK